VLDPGAELPTPVDLSIDYPSSLQLRVRGSLTGTGSYTYDPEFRDELTDVDGDDVTLNNVLLTFGDVKLAGTAEFALVTRSVTADVDGPGSARCSRTDSLRASRSRSGARRTRRQLGAHHGLGQLAVATLKSATPLVDGRSYTALKMGNVVVAGT
jgi:hypothetical protein